MNKLQIEFIDQTMAAVLAEKSESQRLQIAWGMWRSARRMLTQLVQSQNKSWTPDQVQQEVNRRMAGGA
jgi:hypothetical protein